VNQLPKSPRLFLLLGFVLIITAVVVFPTKIILHPQPIDADNIGVGWIFSPVIGAWGLFSATFGLIQEPWKKLKVQTFLLPILTLALGGLLFIALLLVTTGSGILREMARGQLFWLFYISLTVIPSLIVITLTIVHFKREEKKGPVLVSKKVKATVFTTSVMVPLLYSVLTYYMLSLS